MTAVAVPLPAVLTADNTTTTGSSVTEEEEKAGLDNSVHGEISRFHNRNDYVS